MTTPAPDTITCRWCPEGREIVYTQGKERLSVPRGTAEIKATQVKGEAGGNYPAGRDKVR